MIKRKLYLDRVMPFVDKGIVKVFTGIRRCGKSVLLCQMQEELRKQGVSSSRIISLNFEDVANQPYLTAHALNERITKLTVGKHGKWHIFLDEIQEVSHWEKCVNSLLLNPNYDLTITGSNAHLLSGELATYLAGRYVEIPVYPFSFAELLQAVPASIRKDRTTAFRTYLTLGGMPFLVNLGYEEAPSRQYLEDIFRSVVLKDIVSRYEIRNVDLLERVIRFLMDGVGNAISANSIAKFLRGEQRTVAPETIQNYIKAAESSLLFYRLRRQDLIGKRMLQQDDKYYLADHGLREVVCGNNIRDINHVLENIVCIELLRRGFQVSVGKRGSREIDFVAEKGKNRTYYQVAYLLASEETATREFSAFDGIPDNSPRVVLSMDEFDFSRDGIKHQNIVEFLLESTNKAE